MGGVTRGFLNLFILENGSYEVTEEEEEGWGTKELRSTVNTPPARLGRILWGLPSHLCLGLKAASCPPQLSPVPAAAGVLSALVQTAPSALGSLQSPPSSQSLPHVSLPTSPSEEHVLLGAVVTTLSFGLHPEPGPAWVIQMHCPY